MKDISFTTVPVLRATEIYEFEETLFRKGIRVEDLIDRASSLIARTIFRMIRPHAKVLCLVGKGNNGRDGFASLKKLNSLGYSVGAVFLSSEILRNYLKQEDLSFLRFVGSNDDSILLEEIKKFNPDVILDCFFGIGFKSPLPEKVADLFAYINSLECLRVAVDVPSGADAQTGLIDERAIRADATVTFFALKPAHTIKPAKLYCGSVVLSDLGFKAEMLEFLSKRDVLRSKVVEDYEIGIKRPAVAHKKTSSVLVVAGSEDMPGAAFLSAKSAFASGAGYVAVASEKKALHIIKNILPEAVFIPIDYENPNSLEELKNKSKDFNCVVIGPGLSREKYHQEFALELIEELSKIEKPIVIDGDGLYALSNIKKFFKLPNAVLTPHPKEAERLLESSENDPLEAAELIARRYRCACVYKSATTVVSDGKKTLIFDEAFNNLAVAGSGDVLSGVIAALIAQGLDPLTAASFSVKIQSSASRVAYEYLNGAPLLASEVIDYIRVQFKNLCGDWL